MALAIAWSYFHRRFGSDTELADNFLVVAPNVIVFERLRQDFESGRVFHALPIIPPEWKSEWQLNILMRGGSSNPRTSGNLFVTNIQKIYDREKSDDDPINPVAALLGPAPKDDIHPTEPMLERIKKVSNLMVLNDEAHHVHDDKLKWNESLLMLDENLRSRGRQRDWCYGWTSVRHPRIRMGRSSRGSSSTTPSPRRLRTELSRHRSSSTRRTDQTPQSTYTTTPVTPTTNGSPSNC